jgi:tRNA pseudouridine38-40 synthase
MYTARMQEVELFERRLLAIDLVANAFLQHMVRVIVGTLLLVGRGKMAPEAFQTVLERRDRRAAGPTAAAHGLTLMAVTYPTNVLEWEL